ncbi:hypothetical protein F1721_09815 [Saccharopolyspora hirsuta]|uniref:Uncharacterized protein n=1 Tax=Saccharopolyspora hirsuta TaxID=1837 RepID=A0A5M7C653_SACHI|nr:hypothetical protein F1721_09815 [Saccharopolyspora hirsuta]
MLGPGAAAPSRSARRPGRDRPPPGRPRGLPRPHRLTPGRADRRRGRLLLNPGLDSRLRHPS